MKKFFSIIKEKLFTRVEKQHSEAYLRRISFLNKYSLLFHILISCGIVFIVEVLSRRNFLSSGCIPVHFSIMPLLYLHP